MKLRWFLYGLGGLVLTICLILIAGFAFVQTESGKKLIANRLSGLLSSPPHSTFKLEELQGFLPFEIRLKRVALGDAEGDWLVMEDLALQWSPASLLLGTLRVKELSASRIDIARGPVGPEEEKPEEPAAPPRIPANLPSIVLEKLSVPQLILGERLLGHAAVFAIDGSVSPGKTRRSLSALLKVERTDPGPQTVLDLLADLDAGESLLALKFNLNEEPDGWIASVAGLHDAGALHAGLEGEGPLADWKGDLRVNAGKYASVEGALHLQWTDTLRVALTGEAGAAPEFLPPEWASVLGPRTSFDLALRSIPGVSVALERTRIVAAGFTTEAQGEFLQESQAVQGTITLQVPALRVLEELIEQPLDGSVSLNAEITGTTASPEAALSLMVDRLVFQDVSVGQLQTELKVSEKQAREGEGSVFDLAGTGSARDIRRLSGPALPESALSWTLAADVPLKGEVDIRQLEFKSRRNSLNITGRFNPETLESAILSRLELQDLRDLQAFTGWEPSGRAGLQLQLNSDQGLQNASARLEGEAADLGGFPEQMASLIGRRVTLSGSMDFKDKELLDISSFRLTGGGFTLDAGGRFHVTDRSLQGNLDLNLPDLQALSAAVGKPLAGSATLKGQAGGRLDAMDVQVALEGSRVVVDGQSFEKIHSELKGTGIPDTARGDFFVHILQGAEKLSLVTNYAQEGEKLHLKNFRLTGPGTSMKGDVSFNFARSLTDGSLEGQFTDLAALGRFLGTQLRGTGQFGIQLRESAGRQDLALQFSGKRIGGPFGDLQSVNLKADLQDVLKNPGGEAQFTVKDFATPGLSLDTLSLTSRGDGRSLTFDTEARGKARSPFDLAAAGAVSRSAEEDRLTLRALKGKFDAHPFLLQAPVDISRRGETIAMSNLDLSFGKARVGAEGKLDARTVDFRAQVADLPLSMLTVLDAPNLSGKAHASLSLRGSASMPEADVTVRLEDLRSKNPDFQNIPPALVTTQASILRNQLEGRLQIDNLFPKPARAEMGLPVRFSLKPFQFEVPPESPLRGLIEAEADLNTLLSFFPQEDHRVRGLLTANLDVGGSVREPLATGEVTLANGYYENWAQGTVLDQLALRLAAKGRRLDIEELRATDGQRGRIEGQGWAELDAAKNFPFDISLVFSDATLVRRDNFTGTVGGTLSLAGATNQMALGGDLVIGPAEIDVGGRMAPAVTRLDVIEIHEGPAEEPMIKEPERAGPMGVALDMTVRAPNRVFVRGRGLDSEWQGNLKIQGSAAQPSILGNLQVVRGFFDFLDKRFQITRGVISFDGTSPPSPLLDITAEARGKDVLARLLVTGFATSPKIELESDPQLPRDEILARLLFGRNLSQITPVQAVKLAQAVRTLTAENGGPGIMGRTRRLLGIDQFELREGLGESAPAGIGLGKYLTDEIYVDVQRDISGQAGRALVEVEVTPNLAVQGLAGSDASTGLGIKWKHDY